MLCTVFSFTVNVVVTKKVTVFPLELRHPVVLSLGQEPELPAVGPDVLKVSALICVGGHG